MAKKKKAKKKPHKPLKKTKKPAKKIQGKKIQKKKIIKKVSKGKASTAKKPVKKPRVEVKKTLKPVKPKPDEKKEVLKKMLLNKREQLLKEVKNEVSQYIKGENRQLVDTALDDGDWSVVDLSEDVRLRQLSAHRETLLKIDEALRKLAEGTYGICESCGEEISEQRLKIMPFAINCRDCQERIEQLEAIEKESPSS